MMERIKAYAYESDVHCIACTKKASLRMKLDHSHPYSMGGPCKDDNGVEYDLVDREGNLIYPVFDISENDFTHCGDCHEEL
jgi:hypothetical protein